MKPSFIYGTAWKRERTSSLVQAALKAGFRAIDTANQPKHYTEEGVGEALKTSGLPRESLFLQTKFTPRDGQDHRIPYDESADLKTQVMQSFESSLRHLGTNYIDSYLLHGPYSHPGLGEEDWEVWGALEELYQSRVVKSIGISNVTSQQLAELISGATVRPSFVQNRCFADRGWDVGVRKLCLENGIFYQGFSLLTANTFLANNQALIDIAGKYETGVPQVIFRFAVDVGMIPLTGTTDETHMRQDLTMFQWKLTPDEVALIEGIGV